MPAGVNRTHVQALLKTLVIAAAVALSLTACGGGRAGLEPVPDKSDVFAAASNSDDQGEAAFHDKSLGIDLVIQVQDKDTKKPLSGIDILVMTGGEDIVFAAIDPEGRYFPAFVTKARSDLVSPLRDRYVASGPMAFPSGTQGTPIVLLVVKTGRIGWQELQIGLGVSDLVQRFGTFQTDHCLTPADLERTGGFPGKFVVVAVPPPGLLEGAPVTSFAVLVDQLAEFLTLRGMSDQPFLARTYQLPKVPLWILEVDGPCGGPQVSPTPCVSPPCLPSPCISPFCLPTPTPCISPPCVPSPCISRFCLPTPTLCLSPPCPPPPPTPTPACVSPPCLPPAPTPTPACVSPPCLPPPPRPPPRPTPISPP